jgi:ribosome-associated protein
MSLCQEPRLARAVEILQDKKAFAITLLDLRDVSDTCDYFLLCTGTSEQHIRSLVDAVRDQLAEMGEKPWHIEGADTRRWVLMDYVHFVVHIFREEARDFYALERLWGDAERTDFADGDAPEEAAETPLEFSTF